MAEDGGILTKIDVNIPGLELIKTPDNEIIAANVITGYNSKPNYYYIEKLNKKLIPDTDINITPPENVNENIKSYSVYYGADYDIYYRNQTGVYGYNNGDEEAILLCDWINSGIYDDYTTLISVISSQKIVCMIKDTIHVSQDSENYNAFILTKVPDDEITPKTVIKLAYTETVDKVINAVINFNLTNEQYLIILNDYSIYNSLNEYNKSVEMLNLDLINGIIPDIVLVDENMPYESYISKGMFINLYDYFDSDAEITRDNVLYGIRTAYETDGKLYCLPAKFTMDTLTVKKSAAGDKPNLTLDEMYDYYKNIPDDGSLFLSAYRESILKNCLRSGIGYFIDFKNGTCNFNGNKFIELLHFIQSYNIQETNIENLRSIGLQTDLYHIREVSIDLDGITRLREDKSYFYETSLINPESFVFLKYIFNNDEYVFKGYPTDSGNGTFINSEYLFGITDQSGCKDGAWEFIKCYLSDEIQTSVNIFSTSFPVTVSAFRHTIESLKEYNYYISSFNDQMFIIKNNKQWDETRAKGSGDILCNITDEDIDAIINFISTSRFCNNYDKKIDAIIWEELDGFFEGSGSAEQASEFIQNRVSIYLSELN